MIELLPEEVAISQCKGVESEESEAPISPGCKGWRWGRALTKWEGPPSPPWLNGVFSLVTKVKPGTVFLFFFERPEKN